jgi:hypothetical protein
MESGNHRLEENASAETAHGSLQHLPHADSISKESAIWQCLLGKRVPLLILHFGTFIFQ